MGADLTPLQAGAVFVGIPAVVVIILVLAILAPGWTRAGRYRPGDSWNYEPVLISAAITGDVSKALTATAVGEAGTSVAINSVIDAGEGGASARW